MAGLPGHTVANRMRAKEISFFIVPLDPAYKAGFAGALAGQSMNHIVEYLSLSLFHIGYSRVCNVVQFKKWEENTWV